MLRTIIIILLLIAIPINSLAYEILDKDYPAPFTGVLLDEEEVADYMTNVLNKKEITRLEMALDFEKQRTKECQIGVWYNTGFMVFGVTLTTLLVFILRDK